MGIIRVMSVVFAGVFAASVAVFVNASGTDGYSSDNQSVTFGGERVIRPGQQATGPVSEEALLLGAAVIGLIGISIMRKTLH